MRILIAAPPKTGNSWLKCLLASVYDLAWLTHEDLPDGADLAALRTWLAAGGFPDDAVFHHHYDYSPELADLAAAEGIHLATILRDPYDVFVSRYFFVQDKAEVSKRADRPIDRDREADPMVGRPIDDPAVLAYLADRFGNHLRKGIDWLESDASVVVRYERLIDDPVAELTRATDRLRPAPEARIRAAVEACRADVLLKSRKGLRRRIRAATSGDWRNHLTQPHLDVFRDRHAEAIRALGYEVR